MDLRTIKNLVERKPVNKVDVGAEAEPGALSALLEIKIERKTQPAKETLKITKGKIDLEESAYGTLWLSIKQTFHNHISIDPENIADLIAVLQAYQVEKANGN